MAETQYLTSAIDGFKAIAGLLSDGHTLAFEQAKSVSDFYTQHKDTNALISEAASNPTPDFKDVCDAYITPFEQACEQSKAVAHNAWMEYQSLSDRSALH